MTTIRAADERRWIRFVAAAVVACVLTEVVREYRLGPSYDIFVDEITYLRLGVSMATRGSVDLYGEPFFLHPPLFFVVEAAVLRVTDMPGDIVDAVYRYRQVNVALAGMTAAALFAVVARLTRQWVGPLVVATLYAIDPFAIRMTSRILLEPAAGLWIVCGYLVLVNALLAAPDELDRRTWDDNRRQRWRRGAPWMLVGALFGMAILTKEPVALFTVVPLVAAAALRWVPRWGAGLAVVTALATYAVYPLAVIANGHWSRFVDEKLSGLRRLSGSLQEYGFNTAGSVSFFDRILERLDTLAGTYAILAMGVVAGLYLLRTGRDAERVVALWAAAAYGYGAYSMLKGTLEEQFFYYIMIPALVVVSVALHHVLHGRRRRHRIGALAPVALGLAAYLTFAGVTWYQTRAAPDDAYPRLIAYLDRHAVPGSSIAVGSASEVAEFVLDDGFTPLRTSEVSAIRRRDVRYVVVSTKSLVDGEAEGGEELFEFLDRHARVRFVAAGRSVGELILYEVSNAG